MQFHIDNTHFTLNFHNFARHNIHTCDYIVIYHKHTEVARLNKAELESWLTSMQYIKLNESHVVLDVYPRKSLEQQTRVWSVDEYDITYLDTRTGEVLFSYTANNQHVYIDSRYKRYRSRWLRKALSLLNIKS